MTPIGKGQRGLIVAAPRTGKTMMLQNLAHGITHNHPEVVLIVLLIDERPEEVTDMQRSVQGEVVSLHLRRAGNPSLQVAEMVIEKAETAGRAREGRGHPPRLDHAPRARLQLGRAPERQDSLGRRRFQRPARSEEVLRRRAEHRGRRQPHDHRHRARRHRQPDGRGDLRGVQGHRQHGIHLDRRLMDKRMFPALDINRSGTRKEELLVPREVLNRVWILRKLLTQLNTVEAMEFLIDKVHGTKDNQEFLESMNS